MVMLIDLCTMYMISRRRAWSHSPPESGFWLGESPFGVRQGLWHVLLPNCTMYIEPSTAWFLSVYCYNLAGRATCVPQTCPVVMPLCLLLHYCAPVIRI